MGILAVVGLVGRIVLLFALMMVLPLLVAVIGGDAGVQPFLIGTATAIVCGLAMGLGTRRLQRELVPRDGFLLVSLIWVLLPAFGALPLALAIPGIGVTDAYFEAASAFTATGATVISGLDRLPLSVNVWRHFMTWVGGLGIIVLAVAILPMLGVGGSQLFKAEITGPMKDQKLTPRIADTARVIWVIYGALSVTCFFAYRAAGMGWADAFMHMNSTVSLGGFSPYDASFGHFKSAAIEITAMVFMLLAGINLMMYFVVWKERSLRPLWRNVEVRAFYTVLAATIALITAFLLVAGTYTSGLEALRHTAFHVISVATTAGYATDDYAQWPLFAPVLMILLGCFATCAGSTGGGIKMIRMLLLAMQAKRELVRLVHPNVVNPLTMGGRKVDERIIHSVIAFMMIYGATQTALTMVLLFSGLDVVTAFTAVVACVNNIGPGLGDVGPAVNYGGLNDFQTWVCTFAMLLGRLELLTVLVLFTPQFWRK